MLETHRPNPAQSETFKLYTADFRTRDGEVLQSVTCPVGKKEESTTLPAGSVTVRDYKLTDHASDNRDPGGYATLMYDSRWRVEYYRADPDYPVMDTPYGMLTHTPNQ